MKKPGKKIFVLSLIFILSLLIPTACKKHKIISLKTLLLEMTDRENLTLYPSPSYKLKQFSSYDRRSDSAGGEGWFANSDFTHFTGIDTASGRKEYILFDVSGPGAVVRWWMTFAGEGSCDGIVRVYIDDNEIPVIEDNILKVLSGQMLAGEPLSTSVSPETDIYQRGHNLYLPLPFREHCRITYECDAIVISATSRKPSIYYNICYRQYKQDAKVISFSKDELMNASALIAGTCKVLQNPAGQNKKGKNKIQDFSVSISSSDSVKKDIISGNSAISRIKLSINAEYPEQALRSMVLSLTFDDRTTVWVPVGDFFGTAYRKTTSSTWNSKVDNGLMMESYWLMPFRKSASLSLINYGDQNVQADCIIEVSKYRWNSRSMYFGASWHEYHQILTAGAESTGGTGRHRDINFADIKGSGVYAGDAVTVFNTVDAWWGEGDEKIFVDGESFPSCIGTGTEDYYGYAWCRPEPFSHPFIAQPSGRGNFHPGTTINMRYRVLDAIPFGSSISSNIELWHWLQAVINYSLTTYWYIIPPYEINIKPLPAEVIRPIPVDLDNPL